MQSSHLRLWGKGSAKRVAVIRATGRSAQSKVQNLLALKPRCGTRFVAFDPMLAGRLLTRGLFRSD